MILDLHDDQQSGSPYGSGAQVPKPESVAFWQTIAAHYLANSMVMFDAYNEPQYPDANTWLNGGGTITGSTGMSAIVSMQALVNAIRGMGAQQIIVIGGISVAGNLRINDPNIVYTRHVYHDVATGDPTVWNAGWGSFLGNYPLYYGEWALLPNGSSYQYQSATPANADQKVIDFMNYMEQNNISWTAWQFDSPFLIQDHTTYAPSKLDDPNNPWTCGSSTTSTAGMGAVVYLHLQSLAMSGGSLTASGDFSGASGSVALNDQDQYITYIVPITVSDTRSSGAGWHLTITSTQFNIVGSPSIKLSSDASSIDGVTASCSGNGICTILNNGITYPLLVPAGDGVPAVSFFQANPYSGIGTFTVTAKMGVLIPADAYAGVYTSSITLDMVSGP